MTFNSPPWGSIMEMLRSRQMQIAQMKAQREAEKKAQIGQFIQLGLMGVGAALGAGIAGPAVGGALGGVNAAGEGAAMGGILGGAGLGQAAGGLLGGAATGTLTPMGAVSGGLGLAGSIYGMGQKNDLEQQDLDAYNRRTDAMYPPTGGLTGSSGYGPRQDAIYDPAEGLIPSTRAAELRNQRVNSALGPMVGWTEQGGQYRTSEVSNLLGAEPVERTITGPLQVEGGEGTRKVRIGDGGEIEISDTIDRGGGVKETIKSKPREISEENITPFRASDVSEEPSRALTTAERDAAGVPRPYKYPGMGGIPEGSRLTEELAAEFLRQANGDKEKARRLAREAGYVF